VELREKLSISPEQMKDAFKHVLSIQSISECVILSTCNRTEIYAALELKGEDGGGLSDQDVKPVNKSILNFLATFKKIEYKTLEKHCYYYFCEQAVHHIFRVSSSLDSLVVGERQILGQLRDGYQIALGNKATATLLNKLFQSAIAMGKRARSESRIGMGAVSVSQAGVELCEELYENLSERSCVIFGAGEMADLAALHLRTKKIKSIAFTNRTFSKAENLAQKYHGTAYPLESASRQKLLRESDIIFSATSSPEYVITYDDMKDILAQRKAKSQLLIDLAIPRDIDPRINEFENVFLYCVDDLKMVVEKNVERRKSEIKKVEKILEEEFDNYNKWYSKINLLPVISRIKLNFEKIRSESVNQFVQKEKKSGKDLLNLEIIEKVSSKITSKIIKELMTGIETCETNKDWRDYSQKLMDVFGIKKSDI
jgi:glutamyl-tRNA reductase